MLRFAPALLLALLPGARAAAPTWSAPGVLGDSLGAAVGGGGDVDGDGWDDVVIGGSSPTVDLGEAWFLPGGPDGPSATRAVPLPGDDDAYGFGASVAIIGDVDLDGYAEIAVGAWAADDEAGRVYVYRGGPDGPEPAGVWYGRAPEDFFGRYVAPAGDVDGDGHPDALFSAPHAATIAGEVYLFLGGPTGLSPTPSVVLAGDAPGDAIGTAVGRAGDVDGDNFGDVLVASQAWEGGTGRVGVYRGGPDGLELAGYLTGETPEDYFGVAVAGGADVDADGYDDVLVGAWGWDRSAGRVYLYRGGAAGVDPSPVTLLTGGSGGDAFGRALALPGDLTGDGHADAVIGADGYGVEEGRAFVYPGGPGGLDTPPVEFGPGTGSTDFGGAVAPAGDADGDGLPDVIVGGAGYSAGAGRADVYAGAGRGVRSAPLATVVGEGPVSSLGADVRAAGDVNGDGLPDVIVGAQYRVYVFLGTPTGPSATPAATLWGDDRDFGAHLAPVGDVDGDGHDDLVIGAPRYGGAGRAYLYRGGPGGPVLAGVLGVEEGLGAYGTAVAGAGDVDGDGRVDVLVGASDWSSRTGRVWLYGGSADGLDPTPRAVLGGEAAGDRFGDAVSGAGDLDGDGLADVLIGAPGAGKGAGRVLVYRGASSGLSPAGRVEGETAEDALGSALAALGDLDGDGRPDVALGAPGWKASTGRVEVRYGAARGLDAARVDRLVGEGEGALFGRALAAGGDHNGDGLADVAVGAPGAGEATGRVYRFGGTAAGPRPFQVVDGEVEGGAFGAALDGRMDLDGDGLADLLISAPEADAGAGAAALYPGAPDWDADGVAAPDDCDDLDATRAPDRAEVCDGAPVDEDCDGLADDADPSVTGGSTWYADADGDGYTDPGASVVACLPPEGHAAASAAADCDDADPAVHPDATEVPRDGIDQDCDGADDPGPEREDPKPDDPGACGCASLAGEPAWEWLVVLLLVARRRGPGRGRACAPGAD